MDWTIRGSSGAGSWWIEVRMDNTAIPLCAMFNLWWSTSPFVDVAEVDSKIPYFVWNPLRLQSPSIMLIWKNIVSFSFRIYHCSTAKDHWLLGYIVPSGSLTVCPGLTDELPSQILHPTLWSAWSTSYSNKRRQSHQWTWVCLSWTLFCLLFGSISGSSYLTQQGIAHDTAWDLWQNIMALGIMAIGFLFIAYIQLRRMKKLK